MSKKLANLSWPQEKSRFPGIKIPPGSQRKDHPLIWLGVHDSGLYLVNNTGHVLDEVQYSTSGLYALDEDQLLPSEPLKPQALGALADGYGVLLETVDEIADSDWLISYHFQMRYAPIGTFRISTYFKKGGVTSLPLVLDGWHPWKDAQLQIESNDGPR